MLPASKAGIKKALTQSAIYPRGFGLAVAALLPERGLRPKNDEIEALGYVGVDHLGSLDDILLGSKKTWWREYTSQKTKR